MFFRRLSPPHRLFKPSPHRPLSTSALLARLRARYPTLQPSQLPSLTLSFLLLHELTAIVPLIAGFFALRSLGAGEALVEWAEGGKDGDGVRGWVGSGLEEGRRKGERIGKKYGWFGYESVADSDRAVGGAAIDGKRFEGQVANLVGSYLIVKALLPLRLGLSFYLAPALARGVVGRFGVLRRWGERVLKKQERKTS